MAKKAVRKVVTVEVETVLGDKDLVKEVKDTLSEFGMCGDDGKALVSVKKVKIAK